MSASGSPLKSSRALVLCAAAMLASSAPAIAAVAAASDDFNTCGLDEQRWSVIDPRGDGSFEVRGTGSGEAVLEIAVPAGLSHEAWTGGNFAPRVMQPAADVDFQLEARFQSALGPSYQAQGVFVEQDAEHFLRCEFYSTNGVVRLFAASFVAGVPTVRLSQVAAVSNEMHLRIARAGDLWTLTWSPDGAQWTTGGSFVHDLAVTAVGPYAANAGTGPANAPAHTAIIDYFFDTAAPIAAEDAVPGPHCPGLICPDVNASGVVDVDDLTAVIVDWGTAGANGTDVDGDGVVGVDDMVAVILGWGPVPPDSACPGPTPPPLEIAFWYGDAQVFGEIGRPQQQLNILGNVQSDHELAALSWSLDGGPPRPLSFGPDTRRLAAPGDFNVEIFYDEVAPGLHDVTVRAEDVLGNELVHSMALDVAAGNTWPLPYAIDWSTVGDLQSVVDVADGIWELTTEGLRCTVPDYDRLVVLGDLAWTDYELTVDVTMHEVDETGYASPSLTPAVGLVLRWAGHTDLHNPGAQPNQGWWPLGAAGEYVFHLDGCGPRLELYGNPFHLRDSDDTCALPLPLHETWTWKIRVQTQPNGKHHYHFKAWPADQAEPAGWVLSMIEGAHQPAAGSIGLLAHHVDVTFGNLSVVPIEPMAEATSGAKKRGLRALRR